MCSVELYSRVRRACQFEGMRRSAAAQQFGIGRKTVAKMLKPSVPPGYRRQTIMAFKEIHRLCCDHDPNRLRRDNHSRARSRANR